MANNNTSPLNFIHTENNLTFVYTTNNISIFRKENGTETFVTELDRKNSIKPAFMGNTDFVLFASASENNAPLYFKFVNSEYVITTLEVNDFSRQNEDDKYVDALTLLSDYSSRYPTNRIFTSTPIRYDDGGADLFVVFEPNKEHENNMVVVDPSKHENMKNFKFYELVFNIADINNGNISWSNSDYGNDV